jgi:hypothetical protein
MSHGLDLTEAIEVGAEALWRFWATGGNPEQNWAHRWAIVPVGERQLWAVRARPIVMAAAPVIEKQVRERIAAEEAS